MTHDRAWILLPSGRRLDLLAPDPEAWTDLDLAIGLSRTYRWAGYSAWDLPLSVAQHSLTVLALCEGSNGPDLSPAEQMRELLHDAVEALMGGGRQGSAGGAGERPTGGGWDPITPLKPHLGKGYAQLVDQIQTAIDIRYALPAWSPQSHARHKAADRLAAASEAYHVAGWSVAAMRRQLGIALTPLAGDPLEAPHRMRPWEPWLPPVGLPPAPPAEPCRPSPKVAESRFLRKLEALQSAAKAGQGSRGRASSTIFASALHAGAA